MDKIRIDALVRKEENGKIGMAFAAVLFVASVIWLFV